MGVGAGLGFIVLVWDSSANSPPPTRSEGHRCDHDRARVEQIAPDVARP